MWTCWWIEWLDNWVYDRSCSGLVSPANTTRSDGTAIQREVMPTVEQIEFLNEFLKTARIAVVVSNSESSYPQATPNWFNWDGERLSISTTKERLKYKNYSRDSKAAVLIYEEPMASDYVQLRGDIEIQDDDQIWGPTRAILGRHLPSEQADAYIERIESERGTSGVVAEAGACCAPERIGFWPHIPTRSGQGLT